MEAALIKPDDLHRLLAGGTPWVFLIEILLRAVVVYITLIVAVRLLGRRIAGGLTLLEISIVVTLAATAGTVLEASQRGLLPAIVVIFVTALLHRGIAHWGVRRRNVERVVTGASVAILIDGRLLIDSLRAQSLTQARLFSMLRGNGVQHLGELSRVFSEASGAVSFVPSTKPRPGLGILPQADSELHREAAVEDIDACCSCGFTVSAPASVVRCPHCDGDRWSPAVRRLEE